MMGLSTHAIRIDPETAEGSSTFSPGSRKLLLVVARYVRLFHIFCYGSFTRSHRPLLTPLGACIYILSRSTKPRVGMGWTFAENDSSPLQLTGRFLFIVSCRYAPNG